MPLVTSWRTHRRWSPAIMLAAVLAVAAVIAPPGRTQITYAQSSAADAYAWAIGGPGADEARQLAFDGEGNLYVAGVFSGLADVSPG